MCRLRATRHAWRYHAFPDRGHSIVLDHGWREIADLTLSWLARQGL
jgi:non-heme chloroperoxidase